MKISRGELNKLIREELETQFKKRGKPRSDSTSKYRRDDPRYENERQRQGRIFPGSEEARKLANCIVETIEEMLGQVDVDEAKSQPVKQCFDRTQMMRLRQSIFNQIMGFINTYENVKKNTNVKRT